MRVFLAFYFILIVTYSLYAQKGIQSSLPETGLSKKGFSLVRHPENKRVDVLYNGKLLTGYCYYDSIYKPFLYPVNTLPRKLSGGVTVTRSYLPTGQAGPVKPVVGERVDHPHHVGIWMNYESVNGLDFWNHSTAIAPERKGKYGTIRHDKIVSAKAGQKQALLVTAASWLRSDGKKLLNEITEYSFNYRDKYYFIDRKTTLTALEDSVIFRDVKDGFFAIRVARELEMPSGEAGVFVGADGKPVKTDPVNTRLTGMYQNSEGVRGDSVWSSKARWAKLTGTKDGAGIVIAMIDHPANPGYPTYWHARGYGLFALNPLGRKVFSKGKEELNFGLSPGTSRTFRYRIIIASAVMTDDEINALADEFAAKL